MRYSLVDYLACPVCTGHLATIVVEECPAEIPIRPRMPSRLVPTERAIVGPLPSSRSTTPLAVTLARYSANPAPPHRDSAVEVEKGLLACLACGRWFPITGRLPELLPDHLRDFDRDWKLFETCARALPSDITAALRAAPISTDSLRTDDGASYKRAEIGIESRVDDPNFFSPGYSSPFNPHNAQFTLYLIKLFGAAVPLLDLKNGDVLLDSGCGYAWTTEWLYKAGVEAIGVDICRTYLDIGIQRMGVNRPHLVVGDVEHLPIRSGSADAVFGYESFHHVPDRQRAMAGFGRALKPGGRLVLAEPGAAHEHAQISVDVMNKYGILEKGMELDDVRQYVAGTPLGAPEQVFLLRAGHREMGKTLDRVFVQTHSAVEGSLFRIVRKESVLETVTTAWRNPRRMVWPRVKRRVKAALVRLGLE
jgi:SAM-dependent methyltransferase/uncharacterized protein YbaR (Trm112 family)